MAGGTYYVPSYPTATPGFFVSAESRVMIGTAYLTGSLEVATFSYTSYYASLGLQAGKGLDMGELVKLSFSHVPKFTPVDSANVQTSNIYFLEGEETKASLGIREFRPEVLLMALGTGVQYAVGNEQIITFGGKCDMITRPLTMEFNNVSCQVPAAANITNGITGGLITLYDTFVSNGLNWDDVSAKKLNELTLDFMVKPVTAYPRGNRLGNIYLY